MTAEQAQRIRADLKAEGFDDVFMQSDDCDHDLGVAVVHEGRRHAVRVSEPRGLASVVYLFKQWRDRLNG
jgi:hypothetical protein